LIKALEDAIVKSQDFYSKHSQGAGELCEFHLQNLVDIITDGVEIPCDIAVDISSRGIQQNLQPSLKILVLLTGVDGVAEELLEVLE